MRRMISASEPVIYERSGRVAENQKTFIIVAVWIGVIPAVFATPRPAFHDFATHRRSDLLLFGQHQPDGLINFLMHLRETPLQGSHGCFYPEVAVLLIQGKVTALDGDSRTNLSVS